MSVENVLPQNRANFILVRHAESEANLILHNASAVGGAEQYNAELIRQQIDLLGEPNLTEKGRFQAMTTGSYLLELIQANNWGDLTIDVLISPQLRAQLTAQAFINAAKVQWPSTLKLNLIQYPTLYEYCKSGKSYCAGETFNQFQDRVYSFLLNLKETPPAQVKIVFGHSLFFSSMLTLAANQLTYNPLISVEDMAIHLPNCSISVLNWNPITQRWSIPVMGSIEHLPRSSRTGVHVQL
jgi:broad specificity phosphatase PhoE